MQQMQFKIIWQYAPNIYYTIRDKDYIVNKNLKTYLQEIQH